MAADILRPQIKFTTQLTGQNCGRCTAVGVNWYDFSGILTQNRGGITDLQRICRNKSERIRRRVAFIQIEIAQGAAFMRRAFLVMMHLRSNYGYEQQQQEYY